MTESTVEYDLQERASVPAPAALETNFPAVTLSEAATKESWRKEVHRPATSTHKWWAKRLGTIFRGIITSATTSDDPETAYADKTDLAGLVVFDPFAGSGVTGVEAAKLGADVVCFDINPVATLVQRQALQTWDIEYLMSLYTQVEKTCRLEVDRVHKTEDGRTALYYFWVATVPCPECAIPIRLFDSTVYSKNAYPKRVPEAQIVCPICLDIQSGRYDFVETVCANGHIITQKGSVTRSVAKCMNGHSTRIIDALNHAIPGYEMYAKMVVDTKGQKTYEPITKWDKELYAECENLLSSLPSSSVLPVGSLASGNNTRQALSWNFTEWHHFFNARQLYSLSLIATAISDLPHHSPEREALCALFSGTLEFNNRFTSFKGEGTGAVRHMFSHHILKPERTPLEAHPWGTPYSSGSFSTLLKSRLLRAHEYKVSPSDLIAVDGQIQKTTGLSASVSTSLCQDWKSFESAPNHPAYVATRNSMCTDLPDGSVDLVVSDPPYMDNVHYAELADFFHAWLRGMAPFEGYPNNETTRRNGEVQHADPEEFGKAIESVWMECERVLKPGGILAFTFHQARITGWINVIESLRRSGFCVTSVQPVKGEMTTSVAKSGSREPSNLDSIIVCRRTLDGATNPHTSLDDALSVAQGRLLRLRDAGVIVGPGDVRSVIRGSLLSYISSTGASLKQSTETVEEYANATISSLLNCNPS